LSGGETSVGHWIAFEMRIARKLSIAAKWPAPAALLVGCSLATGASSAPKMQATDLTCAIRVDLDKGFVRLEAIVQSDGAVIGQYDLNVVKNSATGTSRNNQSGGFQLIAASRQVLTTIVLDPSAAGHYRAELSLQSNRGRASCSSPS
jgi:hypothetical protein